MWGVAGKDGKAPISRRSDIDPSPHHLTDGILYALGQRRLHSVWHRLSSGKLRPFSDYSKGVNEIQKWKRLVSLMGENHRSREHAAIDAG